MQMVSVTEGAWRDNVLPSNFESFYFKQRILSLKEGETWEGRGRNNLEFIGWR